MAACRTDGNVQRHDSVWHSGAEVQKGSLIHGRSFRLVTIVQGVTDYVMDQFSGLGAGTIQVSIPGTALKTGLTERDLDTLRGVEGTAGVSPQVSLMSAAEVDGEVYKKISIDGESAIYFLNNDVIESGRPFGAADMGGEAHVCIVDHTFIRKAMWGKKVLGSTIRLGGYEYQIVGIQKDSDSMLNAYTDTSSYDGTIMIPYTNAMNMSGASGITSVEVYIAKDASSGTVEKNLRKALNGIFNDADNAFSIFNMERMQAMLGGIASIALLVGGIGIMNMMLVSVSERTKEIGLRKALGAEPARIQTLFLFEAVTLSVFGGLIGVGIGELIAAIGSVALKIKAVLLGLGFSLGVGIVFGWAPARRASRLNPIDALRSE